MLPPPPPSAISETSTLRSHDSHALSPANDPRKDVTPPIPTLSISTAADTSKEPENPWLVDSSGPSKVSKRKNELVSGKSLTLAQKSEIQMQKQLSKSSEARGQAADDATLELNTEDVLTLDSKTSRVMLANGLSKKQQKKEAKKAKKQQDQIPKAKLFAHDDDDDSDANSEVDAQEVALRSGKKPSAFEQRDLVARAFAGDNVIQVRWSSIYFYQAIAYSVYSNSKRRRGKRWKQMRLMKLTPPCQDGYVSLFFTCPTCLRCLQQGSWGGAGVKKAPPKPHLIKKVAGIDPKTRADYGKAHVIISEKRDKKALKYAVKDLPYPYTSKAQFEARMSTPIGSEWNTRLGFQRGTLPRVVKKVCASLSCSVRLLTFSIADGNCHSTS